MSAELTEATEAVGPAPRTRPPLRRIARPLALLALLVVAALFRLHDLNWDQGRSLHPDERYISVLAGLLKPPADVREYFDSGASPLNPFNTDWGRSYVYGTLPLFVGRYLAEFFDAGCGPDAAAVPGLLGRAIFGQVVADCGPGAFDNYATLALVGRFMSAMADVFTVLLVYLLGRRLFGWRVGLLAAALSTITVLQIQQAHYFTVDATANLFVMLSLYFSARMATRSYAARRDTAALLVDAGLAGAAAGLAVASKISTWPTVAVLVVCIAIALLRDRRGLAAIANAALALVLAGAFAFIAFRIAQPYAFVGNSQAEFELTLQQCAQLEPGALTTVCQIGARLPPIVREIFAPSSRWIQQLNLAQGFVNGTVDAPFGIQWTNRMPIVFPLINLVFWGMGIPLAVAAIAGFFYGLRQLLRGRRWWAYLPLVLWTGMFFLYQSTQWTKSIRYLLPIYPALCIFGALALVALWRAWGLSPRTRAQWLRYVPAAAIALVIGGTLVWALAFMQIYAGDITRVQASRWVYENVPTAATLQWAEDGRARQLQLPVTRLDLGADMAPQAVPIRLTNPADAITQPLRGVTLRLNQLFGAGEVEARLIDLVSGDTVQTVRQLVDETRPTVTFDQAALQPGVDYAVELSLIQGQGLSARTSVVANEHWDDAVPQPLDGRDPYGSYYRGLATSSDGQMQNYNDDTADKRAQMLSWLDEADYLVLSSNRLYASIPRLPWRYPMTMEYYRALMNGELGFDLAADFNAFPRIGPFIFNDQEMPQFLARAPDTAGTPPGIEVPYPTAEEAFSVYDHPRVLVFAKTPRYTRENAERILGAVDVSRTIHQTPRSAADAPNGLLLDDRTLAAQQAGGTWSELFPRSSPLNQSQFLAVLAWVALVEALGVAGFMLLASAARARRGSPPSLLIDGGYAFAKVLGLLLVAFTAWWLASLRLAAFTPALIWVLVIGLCAVAAVVGHLNRDYILNLLRRRWPVLVAGEALFLGLFAFFLFVRAGNPDLWHPYMGGEKPMDFAYLNSVLRATYFPPQDPWFAGGAINYYYFGFVLIGAPIKALGIDPAVAYNIAIPTLFALTGVGAFGLGASFYASRPRDEGQSTIVDHSSSAVRQSSPAARPIVAGLLAALFVVGVGNGDQIRVVGPAWQQLGGVDQGVSPVVALVSGIGRWIGGAPLPVAPNWPYWNPTRPAKQVPIAEFPQFTFLYADLHAHMMAMPLALLAVAFALAYAGGARKWWAIVLGAVAVGMLWPTNTWDYPPYLLLALCGLALGAIALRQHDEPGTPLTWRRALAAVIGALPAIIAFVALSRAAMIPYLANYGSAYNSVERWMNERTPLNTFITIYGLFLIPLAFALVWNAFAGPPDARRLTRIALAAGFAAGLLLAVLGVPVAILAAPMAALSIGAAFAPRAATGERLLWLMTAGAWLITLFVELFVLSGDIGRMNTVFKFYIQAWLMLGVAAAVALVWAAEMLALGERRAAMAADDEVAARAAPSPVNIVLRAALTTAVAIALFLALLYPTFAIPAKIADRYDRSAPRGLDGMAYMRSATHQGFCATDENRFPLGHDYDAIRWLQDNVKGSPTIMEGTTGGQLYCWGNRYSIYTGLPAVIGWQWHQRQQRASLDDRIVYDRDGDVTAFYTTPDLDQARAILRRYRPGYIVVGPLEQTQYGFAGLSKFDAMVEAGELRVAYQNPGVTIYEVVR